jgi:hypothetical protein
MIDQDGKGRGIHWPSSFKLIRHKEEEMKGKIDKKFWGISIYFFSFFSFYPSLFCQANEVAEAHFILLNPHHPSAAFP